MMGISSADIPDPAVYEMMKMGVKPACYAAMWQSAWDARLGDLKSVSPILRPLVLLAREIDRPTNTPSGGTSHPKYGSDEDGWQIHNG